MSIVSIELGSVITATQQLFTFTSTTGASVAGPSSLTWSLLAGGFATNLSSLDEFDAYLGAAARAAYITADELSGIMTQIKATLWIPELQAGVAPPTQKTAVFTGTTGYVHMMSCAIIPFLWQGKTRFLCGVSFATASVMGKTAVSVTLKTTNFLFWHKTKPIYSMSHVPLTLEDTKYIVDTVALSVTDMVSHLQRAYPAVFNLVLNQHKPTEMSYYSVMKSSLYFADVDLLLQDTLHRPDLDQEMIVKSAKFDEKGQVVERC